ncbi:MAG: elongation factor P [Candidatus Omnitrophica bacterium]|nr:elongation factor P [Candidatus Omnitrophota bacterium]MBU1128773.1 elongation factor P [Candidatus Omnitrophota bacterium]MBU1656714.1 elongation factor P [Candidatus Omnitrophota bacterium]MBU1785226.1 elongation factor P [Candidatus Omnitrophota bacterium]MBU1851234.1 elongation factor P [Candidatus Omnitrophota bacterium]
MISAKQLRQGTIIKYNNQLHEVVAAGHYKPGKGGAFVRAKLRNVATGSIISETLRPDDTFEQVYIEQQQIQFLYKDDMGYCFMDETTFEQTHIPAEKMGQVADYLKDNMTITANVFNGEILTVTPPVHVTMKIIRTEPGARGNTVSGATKSATLETGKIIKVPLFVAEGELVKIDTRTGEYIERA